MYQAAQNVLHGFGAICGASVGGAIAETIGWRWCFLLQVPLSVFALVVGRLVIRLPQTTNNHNSTRRWRHIWDQVDILGTVLLVLGLSVQLVGLSLGGNELPWSNPWIILSLIGSVVLLALFLWTEAKTSAAPIIPLRLLHGTVPICIQIANLCVGMGAYAVSDASPSRYEANTTPPVFVQSPAIFPSCSLRLSQYGRCKTGHSFLGNSTWWPHCRYHHVTLGQTVTNRANRSPIDVCWQFVGRPAPIQRCELEILCLCFPCQPRPRNGISWYIV